VQIRGCPRNCKRRETATKPLESFREGRPIADPQARRPAQGDHLSGSRGARRSADLPLVVTTSPSAEGDDLTLSQDTSFPGRKAHESKEAKA